MKTLKTLAAAGLIASTMALAPAGAQAQTAESSFDGYRVLAVTAGVVVGAAAAAIVTEGLIIPAYAWATTGTATGLGGMGPGGMAGAAGASGQGMMMSGTGATWSHAAYNTFRGGMRVLGAVGGGFYADSWYTGK